MRLQRIIPEYEGRVRLRLRAFPLEIHGEAAPRDILEQEWWLAAIQEPAAIFKPYRGDDWPTTTLPTFDAAWCAAQQGETLGHDFDVRVRRAFFGEGRNIGRRDVLFEIATETGLDMADFARTFDSDVARVAVLEEEHLGRERYHVKGTPTLMLADGTRLRQPIAFPSMRNRKVVAVAPLPCLGEGCVEATRALFEQALSGEKEMIGGEGNGL